MPFAVLGLDLQELASLALFGALIVVPALLMLYFGNRSDRDSTNG
jgi:hypothetical protein